MSVPEVTYVRSQHLAPVTFGERIHPLQHSAMVSRVLDFAVRDPAPSASPVR